jgi:hypothetical protein
MWIRNCILLEEDCRSRNRVLYKIITCFISKRTWSYIPTNFELTKVIISSVHFPVHCPTEEDFLNSPCACFTTDVECDCIYLLLEKKVTQDSSIWDILHCQLVRMTEVSKESSGFICSIRRMMRPQCSSEMSGTILKIYML